MNKKNLSKVIGFGLLLFIITMVLLFVLSIVTGSDQPMDFWWVGAVMAVVLAFISRWFAGRIHPETQGKSLAIGIIWAIMVAGILLIIAIPNGTTNNVFGQWPTYLVFIGIAVGPALMKPKKIIEPVKQSS